MDRMLLLAFHKVRLNWATGTPVGPYEAKGIRYSCECALIMNTAAVELLCIWSLITGDCT